MNKLLKVLTQNQNVTYTGNGAKTNLSTNSKVLDYFSRISAMRQQSALIQNDLFKNAWSEDAALALKTLFYTRDIRGGQGERQVFRNNLQWLVNNEPELVKEILPLIPLYGRWDDVVELINYPAVKEYALEFITNQLNKDIQALNRGENISLLGKWCPGENTSSSETRLRGHIIREYLNVSPKQYRQTLSALRKQIGIVEQKMSANEWSDIDYEKVPSRASTIYRKAFSKHDTARYGAYLGAVEKGEAKINTSTLYPYDLVRPYFKNIYGASIDQTVEVQWKNLPNYINDRNKNTIVVCDVSGSMTWNGGMPILVCASLGLYFAEKSSGVFKDHVITFDTNPKLVNVSGNSLHERIQKLMSMGVGGSTNIQGVFELILNTAKQHRLTDADMPRAVVIVSDMQFNSCASGNSKTNFEAIEAQYKKAGYTRPNLIFWNVNASNQESPVTKDELGTALVSGCSPTIFKAFLENTTLTPYDMMLNTLNAPRYDLVSQLNKLTGQVEKKKSAPKVKSIKISKNISTKNSKKTKKLIKKY